MPRRFFELAIRGRRFIARTVPSRAPGGSRLTARRQLGGELTQFSFRLAFMIDLAYVGLGALGGAAVGRATTADAPAVGPRVAPACSDRGWPVTADTAVVPNAPASARAGDSNAPASARAGDSASTSHQTVIR
jgi:hypothetical protein